VFPYNVASVIRSFGQFVLAAIRGAGGIAAAMLPVRVWPSLDDHLPVWECALLASVLTVLAGAAIGIPGFFSHASSMAAINTHLMLEAAQSGRPGAEDVTTAMAVGMSSVSLFTFLLLTPTGWATMYLGLTGLVRTFSASVDDPLGDPLLTMIDAVLLRTVRTTRTRNARSRRESLEGPEVTDRILTGAQADVPQADLVIVASRRKPDWDAGTIVMTSDRFYRVGYIVERTMHGRLRTLYPLTEHRDHEVFRRAVRYEMPQERSLNRS
jgi:hypothetical protein